MFRYLLSIFGNHITGRGPHLMLRSPSSRHEGCNIKIKKNEKYLVQLIKTTLWLEKNCPDFHKQDRKHAKIQATEDNKRIIYI